MLYDNYLIIDLEATCCNEKTIKRQEMEIIEIGAVMVDGCSLNILDEWQTFIKPIIHPKLTRFCQELTSISQADVDNAPLYPEAIKNLHQWLKNYYNYIFGSWGNYDKNQFIQDSNYHQISYPINADHVNLKELFSLNQGFKTKFGMARALEIAGIELKGTHHRGIDDARNIARLMPYILGQKKINS
jgi:inhibitor of KinA sporulation pathway (predicted exonuclease)